MTTATPTPVRSQLPAEFLEANRRERILQGFATAVAQRGYQDCHIADIVRAAGCSRKSFYETFSGKSAAGHALLSPELRSELVGRDPDRSPLARLVIELAAECKVGDASRVREETSRSSLLLRSIPDCEVTLSPQVDGDPLHCTLPPGRHGLDRDFVSKNQRQRLLTGLVRAVAAEGYPATTIADVTRNAAVSRRTFYEHFVSKHTAAFGLFTLVIDEGDHPLGGVSPDSSIGGLAVEVVAALITEGREAADARANEAAAVLSQLGEAAV